MFVKKYQLIEVPISAMYAAYSLVLQDEPSLRSVQVLGVEVFAAEDVPFSPTQVAVTPVAMLQNMFITFYTSDPDNIVVNNLGTVQGTAQTQSIKRLPILRLRNMDNGGTTQPHIRQQFQAPGNAFYWEQTKIEFGALLANSNPVSLLLGVTYQGTPNG